MGNLVPERRMNKNGVWVTKHVRADGPAALQSQPPVSSQSNKARRPVVGLSVPPVASTVPAVPKVDEMDANERMRHMDRALQLGTDESLMALFDAGMDIDQTDYEGRTALMLCIARGRREAAEALIRRGADVNALYWYHGRIPNTPLDAAVQTKRTDLADTLRAHGALLGRDLAQRNGEAPAAPPSS